MQSPRCYTQHRTTHWQQTNVSRVMWPYRLTFSVCGAADDVGEFGLQAGVSAWVGLGDGFISACSQRHHTLHRGVGPQTLALMDGQSSRVVDQETTVLDKIKNINHMLSYHNQLTIFVRKREEILVCSISPKIGETKIYYLKEILRFCQNNCIYSCPKARLLCGNLGYSLKH